MRRYVIIVLYFVCVGAYCNGDLTTQAIIKSEHEVTLSSEIKGKIIEMPLRAGDRFKKGDLLLGFDCTVNRADLKIALAKLQQAQKNSDINQRLRSMNAISKTDLSESEARLKEAQAERQIKFHHVALCTIRAPYDGELIKRHVSLHQTVNQGEPLLDIVDTNHLTVELIAPSSWLRWIKKDMPFVITIDENGKKYQATITKIISKIDSVSQTIRIIAKIEDDETGLVAGMSGHAAFKQGDK